MSQVGHPALPWKRAERKDAEVAGRPRGPSRSPGDTPAGQDAASPTSDVGLSGPESSQSGLNPDPDHTVTLGPDRGPGPPLAVD